MPNNDLAQTLRKIFNNSSAQTVGIPTIAAALANSGNQQVGFDDTLKRETQRALEQQQANAKLPLMQRAATVAQNEPDTPPAHVAAVDSNGQFTFAPNTDNPIIAKAATENHPELQPGSFWRQLATNSPFSVQPSPLPLPIKQANPDGTSPAFNPLAVSADALTRPRIVPTSNVDAAPPPPANPPFNPLAVKPEALRASAPMISAPAAPTQAEADPRLQTDDSASAQTGTTQDKSNPLLVSADAIRPRTVAGMINADGDPLSPLEQNSVDSAANNSKDNVRKKGWQSVLLGALTGGLQGLASGRGLAGGLGGAITGGALGGAQPEYYDKFRQDQQNAKLAADRARIYGGMAQQASLNRAQADTAKVNAEAGFYNARPGLEQAKTDQKTLDSNQKWDFNKVKLEALNNIKQQMVALRQAGVSQGDARLKLLGEHYNEVARHNGALETDKDLDRTSRETVANIMADNRLDVADANNQTRRDVANQSNTTRSQIANGSLEQRQKAADIAGRYKASDIITKGRANLLTDDQINAALKTAGFPPINQ